MDEFSNPPGHRSGYVAVVGKPNVGKSTLVNGYLGQKIAIVSEKPQTTRNRILGILTRDDAQVIFVDTPGIHDPLHKLGEYLVETANRVIPDSDVVVFLVDASGPPTSEDRLVAQMIRDGKRKDAPVILALNKADLLPGEGAPREGRLREYSEIAPHAAAIFVSAARGDGRAELLDLLVEHLPPGPPYYPEDQVTDLHVRFIAAELVREAALKVLHQEVPHSMAVSVEEFKERSATLTYIGATIHLEKESQKKIVIGKKGETLKRIGTLARAEIEDLLQAKVYLELWVKVRPKWRKDEGELRRMGYSLPPR